MPIITIFAIGTAIVGAIGGLVLGLITAVITGSLARIFFKTKLPYNWDYALIPAGLCIIVGLISGYIVGMKDSLGDASFDESTMTTLLFSLIGPPLGLVSGLWMARAERELEKVIDTHPNAAMIYSQILQEYERQKNIAKKYEDVNDPLRIDVMKEVMGSHGLLQDHSAQISNGVAAPPPSVISQAPFNASTNTQPAQETIDNYGVRRRINNGREEWWDGHQWRLTSHPVNIPRGMPLSEPMMQRQPMAPPRGTPPRRQPLPDADWNGEYAKDGYEWLEHPRGSDVWYWRDEQTGQWVRH